MKDEKRPSFFERATKARGFKAYSTSTLEDVKNDFQNAFASAANGTIRQTKEDIDIAIESAKKRSATILEETRKFGDSVLEMQQHYEHAIGNAIKQAQTKADGGSGTSKFSPFGSGKGKLPTEIEVSDEEGEVSFEDLAFSH
ncbi:hypothetical protein PPYR_13585 [Photinus pyralis]|uniref:Uncharacterized protein n=1 Tax=Photinus pyralis TaxID=7054 RepID=A0A1Y1KR49_PHOPY|nr:hypothetical protein PPYR_13585 [Photinus pyralis]